MILEGSSLKYEQTPIIRMKSKFLRFDFMRIFFEDEMNVSCFRSMF